MAGGRNKIHEHPNAGKTTFKDRPHDINKNGAPKKRYNVFIEEQKKLGNGMVSKTDLKDAISIIINMTEEELIELGKNKNMPFTMRSIIQNLIDPSTRQRELQDWRNWIYGMASQDVKMENTVVSGELKVKYEDD